MAKEKLVENQIDKPYADISGHYIVGIGASAGGLDAINEFFENMPDDTGISFIVIQHLSSDYKSLIIELVEKHTRMKVFEAGNGMPILPNHIYVIPNNKNIVIKDSQLYYADKEKSKAPNMAIDIFLESLAIEQKERGIAIILSGTGTDGTKGVTAIRQAGGLVLVQEPETAQFDGMPNSAIESGNANFILSPASMPEELLASYKGVRPDVIIKENLPAEEEAILREILSLVRKSTQCDFSNYKRPTIIRRLTKRMGLVYKKTLSSYLDLLNHNPDEIQNLSKEFLIGVTHFFRDAEAFKELKEVVIPDIIKRKPINDPIKIWIAACSTGEEAYSVAILFKEYLEEIKKTYEIKIFATDIDKDALDVASKGYYTDNIANNLAEEVNLKYFIKEGAKLRIHPDIRKMIIFSHHDVINDVPYSKLDLVSCRNMLIYFEPSLQRRCLSIFHFSLNVGGYLFLGSSESIGDLKSSFAEVNKKWRIYQNMYASKGLKLENISTTGSFIKTVSKQDRRAANIHTEYSQGLIDVLLAENNSAGVYVDENFNLLETFGDYKNYLEFPDGKFDTNILKLVPKDLAVVLSASLRKAVKENITISLDGLTLVRPIKNTLIINLRITPYLSGKFNQKVLLILLKEVKQLEKFEADGDNITKGGLDIDHYLFLERELKETKSALQRTIEDFETTGEELQSSNEELISANEELQSSNEELQSLNEELHTVNTEHQLKIKEISDLNDDLNNYLRSTDIGLIFLDRNLIIRKFTPFSTTLINLIESDVGRPITHISSNIGNTDLWGNIINVIETAQPYQQILWLESASKWYQMKILPYLREGKNVDGAILILVDITDIKKAEEEQQKLTEELRILNAELEQRVKERTIEIENQGKILNDLFTQAPAMVCTLTGPEHIYELVNPRYQQLFGKRQLVGKRLIDALPEIKGQGIIEMLDGVYQTGKPFVGNEIKVMLARDENAPAEEIYVNFIYQAMFDGNQKPYGILVFAYEVSQEVKARRAIEEAETRTRLAIEAADMGFYDWDLHNQDWLSSQRLIEIFGFSDPNTTHDDLTSIFHPDDKIMRDQAVVDAYTTGSMDYKARITWRHDKSQHWIRVYGKVIFDENKVPLRMYGMVLDITDQKTAEERLKIGEERLRVANEELAASNKELAESNVQLSKTNADLDNFIYTASHDLKSPVSNIEGLVNTLADVLKDKADVHEEVSPLLEMVHQSIERFAQTIKDLTTVSVAQRDFDLEASEIDIKELVDDIKLSIRDQIVKTDAKIKLECTACPQIKFSNKNLKSIVFNLVNNAIKYRSPKRDPEVHITVEKKNDYILLTIKDNGLGISKANQGKMFSMFKRFHNHVEGSGIGLYLVKRIVDNAGGKIEVESEVDKGTTFRLYLKYE